MTDLKARFQRLDTIAAPDLWADVVDRALAPVEAVQTVRIAGRAPRSAPGSRARATVVVLGLLVGALVAAALLSRQTAPPPFVYLVMRPDGSPGDLMVVRPGEAPVPMATGIDGTFDVAPNSEYVIAERGDSVVLIPTDGSPERTLSPAARIGRSSDDVWAADSHAVAFTTGSELVVVDPEDGSEQRFDLPPTPAREPFWSPYDLSWSPDNRHVLAVVAKPRQFEPYNHIAGLALADTAIGTIALLGEDAQVSSIAWSSDGTRIATMVDGGLSGTTLQTWDVDTRTMTVVVPLVPQPGQPMWTSDDRSIQWIAMDQGELVIRQVPATGGQPISVEAAPTELTWSPDRRRAAWVVADGPTSGELWIRGEAGSRPKRIATEVRLDMSPVWSPDSAWLAVGRGGNGAGGEIWLVKADGSEERFVARVFGSGGIPRIAW